MIDSISGAELSDYPEKLSCQLVIERKHKKLDFT